jgi:hypothetical protein
MDRPKDLVPIVIESERDAVMRDIGDLVSPMEREDVMGDHALPADMSGMINPQHWSIVVATPDRPASDLREVEGVEDPGGLFLGEVKAPREEDAAVGHHDSEPVRQNLFARFQLRTQECVSLPFRVATALLALPTSAPLGPSSGRWFQAVPVHGKKRSRRDIGLLRQAIGGAASPGKTAC